MKVADIRDRIDEVLDIRSPVLWFSNRLKCFLNLFGELRRGPNSRSLKVNALLATMPMPRYGSVFLLILSIARFIASSLRLIVSLLSLIYLFRFSKLSHKI